MSEGKGIEFEAMQDALFVWLPGAEMKSDAEAGGIFGGDKAVNQTRVGFVQRADVFGVATCVISGVPDEEDAYGDGLIG